ncbi:MAG: Sapep family Mn(2+)-dependent dipeptidase, partial [Culicoidibacterales bacterium]
YADIGSGSEMLGILGHLDVVPVGDLASWEFDPFDCQIVDGKLICRGTQDDKGPTLAALFAVKALIDSGVQFNKKIRLIFGTDEENLWRDMAKYRENNEVIPDFGFTPDASFPLIHAEKGLLQVVLTSNQPSPIILQAGSTFNSVPDQANYQGEQQEFVQAALKKRGFAFEVNAEQTTVVGTALHSQVADQGQNAISRLALALADCGIHSEGLDFITEVIGEDANGTAIISDCVDEITGKLTVNVGKLSLTENGQEIALDIRIPVSYDLAAIEEPLKMKAQTYGLTYTRFDWLAPIHVPLDHVLVQTLRRVYETETGMDSTPETSGGATYARALENCVAFGMVFPESAKTEHQPNEYITLTDLVKATQIYAQAIYELVK